MLSLFCCLCYTAHIEAHAHEKALICSELHIDAMHYAPILADFSLFIIHTHTHTHELTLSVYMYVIYTFFLLLFMYHLGSFLFPSFFVFLPHPEVILLLVHVSSAPLCQLQQQQNCSSIVDCTASVQHSGSTNNNKQWQQKETNKTTRLSPIEIAFNASAIASTARRRRDGGTHASQSPVESCNHHAHAETLQLD